MFSKAQAGNNELTHDADHNKVFIVKILALFAVAALTACASRQPSVAPNASTAAVSQSVNTASDATERAAVANTQAIEHVTAAHSIRDRVDAKAVVILRFWDSAR